MGLSMPRSSGVERRVELIIGGEMALHDFGGAIIMCPLDNG